MCIRDSYHLTESITRHGITAGRMKTGTPVRIDGRSVHYATNSWINGSHFRDDKIQTLNAANKISGDGIGTGASQWAISSYFARVSYNYDSKYMLTMNMRCLLYTSGSI